MSNLPEFDTQRPYDMVERFARRVFTRGNKTHLHDLVSFEDGHYRAIFEADYFILQPEKTEPSKSQWNTLKKHIKRIDRRTFIFKKNGTTDEGRYWIDFGFFDDD